jgi:hypothetical protein
MGFLVSIAYAGPFSDRVYPALERAGCRSCHNPDGVASATQLQFPEAGVAEDRIEVFGKSLVAFVDRDRPAESLLLNKPTNRIAHTGGQRITPDSPEETLLKDWIGRLAKMTGPELAEAQKPSRETGVSGTNGPVLRRLTNAQYNNTVRDLLGELGAPGSQFPPEDFVNGYKNQYQAQSLSPMLFEGYSAAAEKLARNVFRRGDAERLIPCKPSVACRSQFVRAFGLKAFRRPLDAPERKRYEAHFQGGVEFAKGAQAVIEAMLQSPHFLFQLDQTPDPALKPYATASRLSYALWNTMPDDALFAAAAAGELNTPKGVEKAARRMLADPKAKEALDEFVAQWMRFDRVVGTGRDTRVYPRFNRESAAAMTEETRRFIADLVWSDRDFMEVFTAGYGFVNAELARIYELPAPKGEWEKTEFPPPSERGGLLGQAAFLTLTSTPNDTSPTSRGLFVREHFLCQHIADPPPGVSTVLPPLDEAKPQTNRQRLAVHTTDQTCASCHNLIDPIGFGFEKFDAIGGRREKANLLFYPLDRKSKEPPRKVELDLDTTGWVAGIADSNFSSPRELGAILARTPQCQECIVKQYFRYVAGRLETSTDRSMIRKVYHDFRDSRFRFQEMLVSMMVAREFPETAAVDVSRREPSR